MADIKKELPLVYDFFDQDILTATTFANKYMLKKKGTNEFLETDPLQTIERVMGHLASSMPEEGPSKEWLQKNLKDKYNPTKNYTWKDLFIESCSKFKGVVPQGSILSAAGNNQIIQSLSNCFVIESPKDCINSIFRVGEEQAQISKRRCGVGLDLSNLRPNNFAVENAANTSSGAVGWMDFFSDVCRNIAQRGRRAALMLSLDVKHPDAELFAKAKQSLTYCTGANVSLKLSDEFMRAVEEDGEFTQQWPIDSLTPEIVKVIKARDLWKVICDCAWKTAEPGLLFFDTIQRNLPADFYRSDGFGTVSTNPCCFSENSAVSIITKSGLKDIKSVTCEDIVWIDDVKVWANTTGYFKSGRADIFRVTFTNDVSLDVTSNHKFIKVTDTASIFGELIEVQNLTIGDLILTTSNTPNKYIKNITSIGEFEVGCIEVPEYKRFTLSNGIISGNSEIPLSPYDSCRLTTICLTKYVKNPFTDKSYFDFQEFEKDVRVGMRIMDSVVESEIKAVNKILNKVRKDKYEKVFDDSTLMDVEENLWIKAKQSVINGRRTGLGTHGLADCLLKLQLRYDSDKAVEQISKIYASLRDTAYDESVEMAKDYGSFPVFDWEKEKHCDFIKRLPLDLQNKIKEFGRRNISILTNAPTGTISMISQTSSGIEPIFRLLYMRRRKVNPHDIDVRVDFVDAKGDKWQHHQVFHHAVQEYLNLNNINIPMTVDTDEELLKYLPDYFITSDKIDWSRRVDIQGVLSNYIDHALSSTINLPSDVDSETVGSLYEKAWRCGIKGLTVYRDGCRDGVLVSKETQTKSTEDRPTTIVRVEAAKRPKSLPCEVHIVSVDKKEYVVIVGFIGDSIYEVFAGEHNNILPKKHFSAQLYKKKEGVYILQYDDKGNQIEVDINEYFKNPQYEAITRLVSTSLRHGTPIAYIVEQLMKSTQAFVGFEKSLARILKKYAKKEDLARKIMSNASSRGEDVEVRFEDGCLTVINHTTNTVESKCE